MANYYDDENNFLFVKKGEKDQLLDYIFVHLDDTDKLNFVAHYASYKDDTPLKIYKLEKVVRPNEIDSDNLPIMNDFTEEQTWKRVKVNGVLPSKWRLFFETLDKKLK